MKERAIELMVTVCSYCKKVTGCCVHGSVIITQDVCSDCDQSIGCRIVFNIEELSAKYKLMGDKYYVEEAVKDTTQSGASHGICQDCMDRITIYVDGGSA